jgi:hypothetical protein
MKMKLFVVLCVLLSFGSAMAAGSCTVSAGNRTDLTAEIIWACTGDAVDGTVPNTSAGAFSSLFRTFPYTLAITVENLATEANVTDNSDIYLYDKAADGADLLESDGVDQLDNATRNFVRLTPNPLPRQVWLGVANQAVASGKFYVTLTITK